MESRSNSPAILQVVESGGSKCSVSQKELSARDYSIQFQERVIARFVVTQSLKQTARDFGIAARVANEILHLANLRRPVSRATASTGNQSLTVRAFRAGAA